MILFVAGMKQQDIGEIYKDRPPLKIGLTLLFVTGILMTLFFYFVPRYFGLTFSWFQAFVLGLAFAVVDIGVPAKVLISKGLINRPVGRITIRSSIIASANSPASTFIWTSKVSSSIRNVGSSISK